MSSEKEIHHGEINGRTHLKFAQPAVSWRTDRSDVRFVSRLWITHGKTRNVRREFRTNHRAESTIDPDHVVIIEQASSERGADEEENDGS